MVQPHTLTLVALSVIFVKVMLAKWEGRGNTIFTCACPGSKETLTTISSMTVRFFKQDWQIMHQSVATTHSINTMVIDTPQYILTTIVLLHWHADMTPCLQCITYEVSLLWSPYKVFQFCTDYQFINNDTLTVSISTMMHSQFPSYRKANNSQV